MGTDLPTGGESGTATEDLYEEAAEAYIETHDSYQQELDAADAISDAADVAEEGGASDDEVLRLSSDAFMAEAAATDVYADRLADSAFPDDVQPLVAAYTAALREDARLVREVVGVLLSSSDISDAEFTALTDASESAAEASLAAMRVLNEAMGVVLDDETDAESRD